MKKDKSINNNSGFKLPENYFWEFEERIMREVLGEETKAFPKVTSGFKVPDAYFENFDEELMEKIIPRKVISIFRRRKFYYAAAVAAVFIGLISTLLFNPLRQESIDSIEISAIEQYIDNGNIDYSSNDISSFIYDEGYLFDNISNIGVNDEAVVDYLNENMEDPSLIFE